MFEIINKFLLAGDKFMHKMHLKQSGFTYSAFGPKKEKIQTVDSRYTYQNELNKACFQHDMHYGDFKDLPRTTSDKVLHNKTFNIAKNPKYDGYERVLASVAYKFFDKKLRDTSTYAGTDKTSGGAIKGSEFYNRSQNSWLQDNNTEMYSAHNEEKSVFAERFIKTLKNKIYINMNAVSKMCILIN